MTSIEELPHWTVKLVGTTIMLLLSIIGGTIPIKLSRDSRHASTTRTLLISLSNCFAGGVFFSTVILDLFPMAKVKMYNALQSIDIETSFPVGEFIVGIGFLMMLVLEQLIHSCFKHPILTHDGHSHDSPYSYIDAHEDDESSNIVFYENDACNDQETNHASVVQKLPTNVISYDKDKDKIEQSVEKLDDSCDNGSGAHIISKIYRSKSLYEDKSLLLTCDGDKQEDDYSSDIVCFDNDASTYDEDTKERSVINGSGTHRKSRIYRTKSLASVHSVVQSNFRTYVLVFAISLHSIFEGLAVGLIVQTPQLIQIYIALFIHKTIISFSIGVQLVDANLPSRVIIICLLIFASMAPIGVGLGVAIIDTLNNVIKKIFCGILQSIATGTFLYVTFFEVLPHELNIEDDKKSLKILFVLIGYFVITGICYYENKFHKIINKPKNSTLHH